ncbi:FtsX-like permease family protein [Candidatus Pacebacteria bacterium]|nr:FtsX-like permease family protein [Candidatus Paceibacterota bacterium]
MRSFRIGLLLGLRQIQRANRWTTLLIIFVMMFTFLNLIAVSGILVGLIEGAERAVRENALGDIIVSARDDEDRILDTESVLRELAAYPEIDTYSVRYSSNAMIEANYKERRDLGGERDTAAVIVNGIDPILEDSMTNLSDFLVQGEFLNPDEEGYIIIGAYYLKEYAELFGDIFDTVDVGAGDTIRLTVGDVSKEFIVKGIIESKVDEINLATYIPEKEFRRIFGRLDRNADQIVIRTNEPSQNATVKEAMIASGLGTYAKILTFEENLPKFLIDIKKTFNLLGTFIGSIGIVVASITIFIIIFINAISRRRYIGILKGIGIQRSAIEIAYVLQAAFYALTGSLVGALVTYGILVPYFEENPIQFPFSDGILSADPESTFWKFVILFIITLIAGFLPAWIIVRQNTLNSILGRK